MLRALYSILFYCDALRQSGQKTCASKSQKSCRAAHIQQQKSAAGSQDRKPKSIQPDTKKMYRKQKRKSRNAWLPGKTNDTKCAVKLACTFKQESYSLETIVFNQSLGRFSSHLIGLKGQACRIFQVEKLFQNCCSRHHQRFRHPLKRHLKCLQKTFLKAF